jgi:hypothetical protein
MRRFSVITLAVLVWASSAAAQFAGPGGTVPVVANNPGKKGTFWRSDVYVLNIGTQDTSIVMLLIPEIVQGERAFEPMQSDPIQVPAGGQLTMANIVQTEFGLIDTKGALTMFSLDGTPLVIGSRTYTVADEGGSYGQDIKGVLVKNVAWTPGLRHDSLFRTNIGIYLPVDPVPAATFQVEIFKADGTEVASGSVQFEEAGLIQKGLGAFGVGTLLDGYAVITCSDPSLGWFAYASRGDQLTGDAVYRAATGRQSDLPK